MDCARKRTKSMVALWLLWKMSSSGLTGFYYQQSALKGLFVFVFFVCLFDLCLFIFYCIAWTKSNDPGTFLCWPSKSSKSSTERLIVDFFRSACLHGECMTAKIKTTRKDNLLVILISSFLSSDRSLRSKRFRASSSRKVGREQKKDIFRFRSNFRAITRLKTLATQASPTASCSVV